MTELKDAASEQARFRLRLLVAGTVVVLAFAVVVARLVFLQVVRHEDLSEQAENNRTAIVPVVPNRGLILDRNGVVLASNYSAYTLEITPSKVADLEQLVDDLSHVVDIQPRDRRRFKKLVEESRNFESLPIRTRLTDVEVARFAAQRYRFPGVDVKARLFRSYPYGELASHVIGYIGRINQNEKARLEDSDDADNYKGTEYIGKLGIEQSYETQLHGLTGVEEIETSAGGRAVRKLASNPATPGNTVVMSIDIKLQKLVEELFGERRGALVALDPKTGEVLAFVSKPTFDPNLFVEGIDTESWQALNTSPDKPLLNRALRGTYAPGSTYKPFMALAALETGKRTPQQAIMDPGFFMFAGHRFRDDKEGGHGLVDMYKSIVQSCDTYYYILANDMGVDLMHDEIVKFGFGELTGIDIHGEVRGVLPSTAWKRRAYKRAEQQKWFAGETISLGIGQGYNNFTMLQLAVATSVIANDGVKMKPHLVKEVVDVVTRTSKETLREIKAEISAKPANIKVIQRALAGVTSEGTGATAFKGAGYLSAGKTGTAQVVTIGQNEKYNAATMPERFRDNALYMAYAPAENPKIALALVVENAGFGGVNAAPIARRVFDYWLMNQYPSEADLAAVQKGQAQTPLGQPRAVADVPGLPVPPMTGASAPGAAPATDLTPAAAAATASSPASAVAMAAAASLAPLPAASAASAASAAASAASSASAAARALHKSRR